MLPMFSDTCKNRASGARRTGDSSSTRERRYKVCVAWTVCATLAVAHALSCGHRDGIVGRVFPAASSDAGSDAASPDEANDAGSPDSASPDATVASVFESEYVDNLNVWTIERMLANASVRFGQPDPEARDGNVAELIFPGDPTRTAAEQVGPAYVTQMATLERFSFGTLRTRVSFGDCAPGEEAIQSILGYFADGFDRDQDGISDDIEIDLQFACGTPGLLYLTVFTDYENTPAGERFQKLSHIVDFSSGTEYDSIADDSDEFILTGTREELVGLDRITPGMYYELGFTWDRDSIRFFLGAPSNELTLWTVNDPQHVPQQPVQLTYNLWHPDSHWFPATGSADYPASDVVMRVDWIRYESFVTP